MLSIHNEPDDRNNYDHVRNEQIKKKKEIKIFSLGKPLTQDFSFKPFRINTVRVEKKTKQNKHVNVKTWTIMHATRHY